MTAGVLVSALPFDVVMAVVLNVLLLLTELVTAALLVLASLLRSWATSAALAALAVAPVPTAANTPRLALPQPNNMLCELSIMLAVTVLISLCTEACVVGTNAMRVVAAALAALLALLAVVFAVAFAALALLVTRLSPAATVV